MTSFYAIHEIGDGLADVLLYPPEGGTYIVRGVTIADNLENDIRARYGFGQAALYAARVGGFRHFLLYPVHALLSAVIYRARSVA